MTSPEPEPDALPPNPSRFQFSLRTLLLVFVVLGSSMALFGTAGIVVFGLAMGLAIFLNQVESGGAATAIFLAILYPTCVIGMTLLLFVHEPLVPARRATCPNTLRQIANALHEYHQVHGCFPPAYIADKNGKPMHSWRVLILPYLYRSDVYQAYNFNEPWDGPSNRKLLTARLTMYACPNDPASADGVQTNYVAVVGPNAAFPGATSRNVPSMDLAGGARQTVLVVETSGSGIAWTEPRDLSLATLGADKAVTVSSVHDGQEEDFFHVRDHGRGGYVAMADSTLRYFPVAGLSIEGQRKILALGALGKEESDSFAAAFKGRIRPNWPNIAALAVWFLSVGALITRAVRSRKPRSGSPPGPTPLPPSGSPNE